MMKDFQQLARPMVCLAPRPYFKHAAFTIKARFIDQ
jgi:hypothetical protein